MAIISWLSKQIWAQFGKNQLIVSPFWKNISWMSVDLYRLFRTYRKCQKVRDCWVIHLCMMSLAVRVPFDDPLFHPKKMYVNGNSTRLLHPSCFTALYIPTYQNAIYHRFKGKRSISADAIFFSRNALRHIFAIQAVVTWRWKRWEKH